ncbi:MAG: hypothetical protein QOF51_2871 [Chloroflexota bacterium]|nr:hypothetical protein [Chloroflexota bacterium]
MAQTIERTTALTASEHEAIERELRIECAAAYRLVDHYGWTDLIYNHISVRLPGPEDRFLINPFGMLYREIRASDLIVIDPEANVIGDRSRPVNPAGFIIHSAVHEARRDVQCVIHTHTSYGAAVSAMACGLLPLSQFAMPFYNRLGYHDYEGLAVTPDEKARLVHDLGQHQAMLLKNHGILTVGRTVAEAFETLHYLERACEIQVKAQSAGTPLVTPPIEVCEHAAGQLAPYLDGARAWPALIRLLDEKDSSYRG